MKDFWRWLNGWGRAPDRSMRTFTLDVETAGALRLLAEREHCSIDELARQLVGAALTTRTAVERSLKLWQTLSPREKDVAALICLHYTTRQAAARLGISPETVKTHVGNLLVKFHVPNRQALREALHGWDFSAWEE